MYAAVLLESSNSRIASIRELTFEPASNQNRTRGRAETQMTSTVISTPQSRRYQPAIIDGETLTTTVDT